MLNIELKKEEEKKRERKKKSGELKRNTMNMNF